MAVNYAAEVDRLLGHLSSPFRGQRTEAAGGLDTLTRQHPDALLAVVDSQRGVAKLVALLNRNRSDVAARHVVSVLNRLARASQLTPQAIVQHRLVPVLAAQLVDSTQRQTAFEQQDVRLHPDHEHLQLALVALRRVAEIVAGENAQQVLVAELDGAFAAVVAVLQRGPDDLRVPALTALRGLMRLAPGVPPASFRLQDISNRLVALLSSEATETAQCAIDVLICGTRRNDPMSITVLHNPDAIPALVALLRSEHGELLQHSALRLLRQFVGLGNASQQLVDAGAVPLLVPLFTAQHNVAAAELLVWLAQPLDRTIVPTLVALLSHARLAVRLGAAQLLERFLSDGDADPVIDGGATEPLVLMLMSDEHRDERERVRAASLLSALANVPASHARLRQTNVMPTLVALLRCGNDSLRDSALKTLTGLVADDESHRLMIDASVGPPLVLLVESSSDSEVQTRALRCLATLARTATYRQRLVDAGPLPVLVSILRRQQQSPDAALLATALSALAALLSDDEDAQRTALDQGVLDSVVASLRDDEIGDEELTASALELLCAFLATTAASETAPRVLHAAGVVETIVRLLRLERCAALAALALQLLTATSNGKRAVVACGGVYALIERLRQSDSSIVWRYAADTLSNLLDADENRRVIADAGACAALLRVIEDADSASTATASALVALQKASQAPTARLQIVANGGVAVLTSLLATEPPVSVIATLLALLQDSRTAPWVFEQANSSLLPRILELLANPSVSDNVKSDAVELLLLLSQSNEGRQPMGEAPVVSTLVELLLPPTNTWRRSILTLLTRVQASASPAAFVGVVAPLVALLQAQDDSVVVAFAADVLRTLRVEEDTARELHADAITALVRLLVVVENEEHARIALQQVAALATLPSMQPRLAAALAAESPCPLTSLLRRRHASAFRVAAVDIVNLLAQHLPLELVLEFLATALSRDVVERDDGDAQELVRRVLLTLLEDASTHDRAVHAGVIRSFVASLQRPEELVASPLVRRLVNSDVLLREAVSVDGVVVPFLIAALADPEQTPLALALLVDSALTMHDATRQALLRAGGQQHALEALQSPSNELAFTATQALCRLGVCTELERAVERTGVHDRMIAVLRSGDDRQRAQGLHVLWCIAETNEWLLDRVVTQDVEDALASVVASANATLLAPLVGLLWAMSCVSQHQPLVRRIEAVPVLENALHSENDHVQMHAAAALWSLERSAATRARVIVDAAAVIEVVAVKLTTGSLTEQAHTARVLAALAVDAVNRQRFVRYQGAVESLLRLLSSGYRVLEAHAVVALASLVLHEEVRSMATPEIESALRRLQSSGSFTQREHAAIALHRLH